MNLAINNHQLWSLLRQKVETADQSDMEKIVDIVFRSYDFDKILPDVLLKKAAQIAKNRHNIPFKVSGL